MGCKIPLQYDDVKDCKIKTSLDNPGQDRISLDKFKLVQTCPLVLFFKMTTSLRIITDWPQASAREGMIYALQFHRLQNSHFLQSSYWFLEVTMMGKSALALRSAATSIKLTQKLHKEIMENSILLVSLEKQSKSEGQRKEMWGVTAAKILITTLETTYYGTLKDHLELFWKDSMREFLRILIVSISIFECEPRCNLMPRGSRNSFCKRRFCFLSPRD